MACRNVDAARQCRDQILEERPKVKIEIMKIDLASLKSVQEFAEQYKNRSWWVYVFPITLLMGGGSCD
jgi:short-subunit dehydrogenase